MIRLNVGGQKFVTQKETLLKNGPNYFTGWLSGSFSQEPIDRSGHLFEWVLNFQRGCELHLSQNKWANLLQEAEYYQIIPLIELCRSELGIEEQMSIQDLQKLFTKYYGTLPEFVMAHLERKTTYPGSDDRRLMEDGVKLARSYSKNWPRVPQIKKHVYNGINLLHVFQRPNSILLGNTLSLDNEEIIDIQLTILDIATQQKDDNIVALLAIAQFALNYK